MLTVQLAILLLNLELGPQFPTSLIKSDDRRLVLTGKLVFVFLFYKIELRCL